MTKICGRCKVEQPMDNFRWKNESKGWRQSSCIPCNIEYNKEHYQRNKQVYKEKAKRWDREQYQNVVDYLRANPCVDCGEADIVCLEFDHLDRAEKTISISVAVNNGWSWERLQTEIAKCAVRCRNCHARVTAKQFGWYKAIPQVGVR